MPLVLARTAPMHTVIALAPNEHYFCRCSHRHSHEVMPSKTSIQLRTRFEGELVSFRGCPLFRGSENLLCPLRALDQSGQSAGRLFIDFEGLKPVKFWGGRNNA